MSQAASVRRPLVTAFSITAIVTLISYLAPPTYAATLVGAVFLASTYWLVLRHDTSTIRHHGLGFGGVFEPEPFEFKAIASAAGSAALWCAGMALLFLPPFLIGYRIWFGPEQSLAFAPSSEPFDEALGQVFAVALPEEMFYRGYLQTALDDAIRPRFRVLGASIGWGLVISSAVFALGHLLTTPNPARLAVFFPSLLFGWLRTRTGGIGAAVLFHAACNLFSAYLARGYGFAV